MRDYYPMMVRLHGRRCVVVGGGAVAERKVRSLLDGGADEVIVIAPHITEELKMLANSGCIGLVQREYIEQDLHEAFLLFAATDSREVNGRIAAYGESCGALVNVADLGESGHFITPSAIRRGELLIAVTTGGASPALTSLLKKQLAGRYGAAYKELVERLRLLREHVQGEVIDETARTNILRQAAEELAAPGAEYDRNEPIDEWMSRLQQAAKRRQ
ncbi:bifunctional precorrin-2 dehydrogenase/sirohydrochlorin ferrochelatase [Paenibacillus sp. OV219]|uniref:precorrin-2 dehydrogenase/sirohydrochlorin ferrochelatase family protein n=1 Tax=Paenibacillus sp. OV219 TaxID=1884377 RepID=UPI0008BFB03E|nr:bifunctional precorrin-2 dehydrogenase/sirohydrochlorin ferrochelatase [Paenibacillus sp. OV219]SEM66694.1 precorrin-2 dehydrogenase / sirohydrochlorin ferrochelatase [Paenibacillus sp. OV219]